MTIEEAIKVLLNERECILRQIGSGCDRNCATCDLVLPDKSIIRAYCMAIDALRTQQEAEKNEPLTLDELRQMKGMPVLVDPLIGIGEWNKGACWALVDKKYQGCITAEDELYVMRDYGKIWLAYLRQPKRPTQGNQNVQTDQF